MANALKSYAATWDADLLLACRKCQKKLKGEPGLRTLAKLKKTINRRNRQHPYGPLHVINVPCMDITNGLLRQYFPRKTDLSGYSQADLDNVAQRLNQRPRKTLGFETPASKLQASVASTG